MIDRIKVRLSKFCKVLIGEEEAHIGDVIIFVCLLFIAAWLSIGTYDLGVPLS